LQRPEAEPQHCSILLQFRLVAERASSGERLTSVCALPPHCGLAHRPDLPDVSKCLRGIGQSIHAGDTMLLCMGLFSIFGSQAGVRLKLKAIKQESPEDLSLAPEIRA
jgi:hypothetical protein